MSKMSKPSRQSTASTLQFLPDDFNINNNNNNNKRSRSDDVSLSYRSSLYRSEEVNSIHVGTLLAKMRQSKWRNTLILLFLFFVSVVVLTAFAYWHVKEDLERTKKDVYALKVNLNNIKQKASKHNNNVQKSNTRNFKSLPSAKEKVITSKTPFVAINMIGANDQKQTTMKGSPIYSWETTLRIGNISSFHNSYITIQTPGYYYVYAQMFFSENKSFKKDVLHFYIRKNRQLKLVVASVPRKACETFCTRYISCVVKLSKNDDLSITSADDGINFSMSRNKAQFGAYLLRNAN